MMQPLKLAGIAGARRLRSSEVEFA